MKEPFTKFNKKTPLIKRSVDGGICLYLSNSVGIDLYINKEINFSSKVTIL